MTDALTSTPTPTPRAMPSPGDCVGRFRLGAVVGRGSMAWVYEATELETGRAVAIKIMASKLMSNPVFRVRFADEVRITSGLRHPNIVDVFDFVENEDPPFLACVMERIAGVSLFRAVRDTPLVLSEALEVMSQLIDALRVVHANGIVHRDLKPSNILLTGARPQVFATRPAIKIVDFGIAKSLESDAQTTQPGTVLGTPRYLAPEQVAGDPVSPATDIYALGEVLFEMLTGARLFEGDRNEVIRSKLLGYFPNERLRMLGEHPESRKVASIIRACGREQPHRPTLDALMHAIDALRSGDLAPLEETAALVVPVERLSEQDEASMVGTAVAWRAAPEQKPWRLGRYTLFERLEGRGLVESFVARHDRDVEFCRLKRLMTVAASDPVAVGRFEREAQLAQYLVHPNIGRVMRSSLESGVFCIAQEWLLGVSLARLLALLTARGRSMPLQIFAPIIMAVLDGLGHAHRATGLDGTSLGVVHRNLKPGAIVVGFSGRTKIQDFGEARASVGGYRTAPGAEIVGSIDCAAPEMVVGGEVDARSDLYAVAAIAYEMLSGRPVVAEGDAIEMLRQIADERPPDLAHFRPDIPAAVVHAISRGLAKRPEDRFESAELFRGALRKAVGRFDDVTDDLVGDFVRDVADVEERETIVRLRRLRRLAFLDEEVRAPSDAAGEAAPPTRFASTTDASNAANYSSTVGAASAVDAVCAEGASNVEPSLRARAVRPAGAGSRRNIAYVALSVVVLAIGAASLASWVVLRASRVRDAVPGPGIRPLAAESTTRAVEAASMNLDSDRPTVKVFDGDDADDSEPEARVREADSANEPIDAGRTSKPTTAPKSTRWRDRTRERESERGAGAESGRALERSALSAVDRIDSASKMKTPAQPPSVAAFALVRARIDALKRGPEDVAGFEAALASLRDASREASPHVSRRVATDLAAAERTLDVSLLETALWRLTVDWHRRHPDPRP
ncbi:MAG: protein kinase [Deltaproteobacteria bacterium]|nr:protein kinase [Deltaproteobacteria bacterium]